MPCYAARTMEYQEDLETALRAADPAEALRQLAEALLAHGHDRPALYDAFLAFYKMLQDDGRERDEAHLGDVMDMLTGGYVGRNL